MKKSAGINKELGHLVASISIQYGKQPNIENEWKKIIAINDTKKRKQQINILLRKMEQNSEQNGFFSTKQEVTISKSNLNVVLFDDKEIYYQFFEILRNLSQLNKNGQHSDGVLIMNSIMETERLYWGGFDSNRDIRLARTKAEVTDDEYKIPSIKNLKGQNCSACVERAVMSHNLWLLTGKTSYYITVSNEDHNFEQVSEENRKDGHAFNIVEYDGIYRLNDFAMNNFGILHGNPIEDIENGKPLKVEGRMISNPGYYANYSKLEQELIK